VALAVAGQSRSPLSPFGLVRIVSIATNPHTTVYVLPPTTVLRRLVELLFVRNVLGRMRLERWARPTGRALAGSNKWLLLHCNVSNNNDPRSDALLLVM
jgi:hypothetical protein